MTRPLLFGALTLAVGVALAPQAVGLYAEQRINDTLAQLQENPMLAIAITRYDRDWFSTEAEFAITFKLPDSNGSDGQISPLPVGAGQELGFQYRLVLDHGPLISAGSLGWLHFDGQLPGQGAREAGLQWPAEQPLLNHLGSVNLLGDIRYQEMIPALSYDNGTFAANFSGHQASAESRGELLHYRGVADQLTIRSRGEEFVFNQLIQTASFEPDFGKILGGGLYEMTGDIRLGSLQVGQLARLDNLAMTMASHLNEDSSLAEMHLGYHIDQWHTDSLDVTDINAEMRLSNYSSEFNRYYQEQMNRIIAQPKADLAAQEQQVREDLLAMIPLFFASKPQLMFEQLRFSLPEGKFQGDVQLSLDTIDIKGASFDDRRFWQQHAVVTAQASADKPLAQRLARLMLEQQLANNPGVPLSDEELQQTLDQQAPMMLSMLEQQGLLKDDGEHYQLDFKMHDGQRILNGQALPETTP